MLGTNIGLLLNKVSVNAFIHEDNAGALVLAETLLPQFSPGSIHDAIKTILFHEQLVLRVIELLKIATMEQLRFFHQMAAQEKL